MPRKRPAVLGPPIRAPMTTSSPERDASKIVVRRVAPKVDCLVVFIESSLLGRGSRSSMRREADFSYRCQPPTSLGAPPTWRRSSFASHTASKGRTPGLLGLADDPGGDRRARDSGGRAGGEPAARQTALRPAGGVDREDGEGRPRPPRSVAAG